MRACRQCAACASSHPQAAGEHAQGKCRYWWQPSGRSVPLPALIVEDDPAICTVLCELLEDAGYRPTLAATAGREALTVLRQFPQPLVVLLDLGLPRLDGAGVCVAWPVAPVRRRQRTRHVYVLVTARDETAVPDRVSQVVIQAASCLPAATPDQRLIGTACAVTASTLSAPVAGEGTRTAKTT